MPNDPKPKPPELPPVDPCTLEDAARQFIGAKKPPGGWKRGAKGEKKPRQDEQA